MMFFATLISLSTAATPFSEWLLNESMMTPFFKAPDSCAALDLPRISGDSDRLVLLIELPGSDGGFKKETLVKMGSWSEFSDTLCGDVGYALAKLGEPVTLEKLEAGDTYI